MWNIKRWNDFLFVLFIAFSFHFRSQICRNGMRIYVLGVFFPLCTLILMSRRERDEKNKYIQHCMFCTQQKIPYNFYCYYYCHYLYRICICISCALKARKREREKMCATCACGVLRVYEHMGNLKFKTLITINSHSRFSFLSSFEKNRQYDF